MKRLLKWFIPHPKEKQIAPVLLDEVETARFPDAELENAAEQSMIQRFQSALELGRHISLLSERAAAANIQMGQDAMDLFNERRGKP